MITHNRLGLLGKEVKAAKMQLGTRKAGRATGLPWIKIPSIYSERAAISVSDGGEYVEATDIDTFVNQSRFSKIEQLGIEINTVEKDSSIRLVTAGNAEYVAEAASVPQIGLTFGSTSPMVNKVGGHFLIASELIARSRNNAEESRLWKHVIGQVDKSIDNGIFNKIIALLEAGITPESGFATEDADASLTHAIVSDKETSLASVAETHPLRWLMASDATGWLKQSEIVSTSGRMMVAFGELNGIQHIPTSRLTSQYAYLGSFQKCLSVSTSKSIDIIIDAVTQAVEGNYLFHFSLNVDIRIMDASAILGFENIKLT